MITLHSYSYYILIYSFFFSHSFLILLILSGLSNSLFFSSIPRDDPAPEIPFEDAAAVTEEAANETPEDATDPNADKSHSD